MCACAPERGAGTECLTGGGDQSDLGADRALPSLAEGAHLDDVGAPLGQRQHGGGVDGPRHLPVAPPLLLEQHLRDVAGRAVQVIEWMRKSLQRPRQGASLSK